jgi:hypothetical protein
VIYRALQGLGDFSFELIEKAGRLTLPAEDLLNQALQGNQVEVLLLAGAKGNSILRGSRARDVLLRSLHVSNPHQHFLNN